MKRYHHPHLISVIFAAAVAMLGLAATALAMPTQQPLQSDLTVGGACGSTIQACIHAAAPGDRVIIPPGTYTEWLWITRTVSLIGSGASTTIIHSSDPYRPPLAITGQMNAITNSTVISGFTLSNGQKGGGLNVQFGAAPKIQNVTLTGNQTLYGGGGLAITSGASPLLINVIITGNRSLTNIGQTGGGGLFVSSGSVQLINSLIADNQDDLNHGQIEVYGGNLTVLHSTIASAITSTSAGLMTTGGTAALTDTIIANEAYGLYNSVGSISGDYNLFYGNTLNRVNVITGTHDVSGDPLFANASAGNYHIFSSSAARAVGANIGITTDFEGNVRPSNFYGKSGYDIGFDQFVTSTSVSLPSVVCGLSETHGLTNTTGWQNIYNSPTLIWPAVSGAEGYKVIYNNNGVHVITTTQLAYSLPPLASGYAADLFVEPHYLADPAVNNTPGACLFTLRYENQPPSVPANASFSANFPDNVWTNLTVSPTIQLDPVYTSQSIHDGWLDPYASTCSPSALFTHSCESGSGLKEERTYFGSDPNGTPMTLWGPVQTWSLPAVPSGVYFFRLSATDNLNQSTPVQSVRVLKLDTISPTVALTYTGSNPSVQNLNLPLQWSGADAYSGIASYDILVNGVPWLSNTPVLSATYAGACNTGYQFVARAQDVAGNVGLSSPKSVSIVCDLTSPTVTLSSPLGGQIISSTALLISGMASDNVGVSQVEVSTDGGVSWSLATGTTAWSFDWAVPFEDGVSHTLLARATDTDSNTMTTAPINVTVDRVGPQLTIDDPALGQIIRSHEYTVTGQATDNSGLASLAVSVDNGATFQPVTVNPAWTWPWLIGNENGISHWLQARAIDTAGNVTVLTPTATVVFVDNVPPVLAFANLVNGQAINTTTYVLRGSLTGALTATLDTGSGPQVVQPVAGLFTHTLSLVTGTQIITATAVDEVGNLTVLTDTVNVVEHAGYTEYLPIVARNYDPNQDRYEPDNTVDQAKSIPTDGAVQRRNFYPAGDVDWVRLDVSPGTYMIATNGLAGNVYPDTVLALYASNGVTQLAFNDDCTGFTRASCLTYVSSLSTTLYLKVWPYDASSIGANSWYDLSVVRQ